MECGSGPLGRENFGDDGEIEGEDVRGGEKVVITLRTVNVEVLEKDAARTLSGDVEVINICGEGLRDRKSVV